MVLVRYLLVGYLDPWGIDAQGRHMLGIYLPGSLDSCFSATNYILGMPCPHQSPFVNGGYNTISYYTVLYSTLLYSTLLYSTTILILYYGILYY